MTKKANAEILEVATTDILPDLNQPRQSRPERDDIELARSVKEHGVLSPILLRPETTDKKFKYSVVYGHRRLWAVKYNKQKTIRAEIRDLSNEEAFEIQIVENLQRTDVNPLEEGIAFEKLSEKYSTKDMALRFGKSESFIAKRISLANLVEDAQKMFLWDKFDLSDALLLARADKKVQQELINARAPKDWRESGEEGDWYIGNIEYYLNNKNVSLGKAIFDLLDENIYPEAGPCTTCPFNSNNTPLLFPEAEDSAICTKPSCFAIKTTNQKKNNFEKVATDPDILCIVNSTYLDEDEKQSLAVAEESGLKIISKKLFETEDEPDPVQSYDEWLDDESYQYEEGEDDDVTINHKMAKKDYAIYKKNTEEEIKQYHDDVATGKIKMAYVVAGYGEGDFRPIRIKAGASQEIESGNAGDANTEILAEICRLEEREKRSKEIDAEKIWASIRAMDIYPIIKDKTHAFTEKEIDALARAQLDQLHYSLKGKIGYEDESDGTPRITELGLHEISRAFLLDKLMSNYGAHLTPGTNNNIAYNILKEYVPQDISRIELEIQETAEARSGRVNKKIELLRKKLAK